MPPIEAMIAFAIAAFILIVIPGPSVLFSVARALEFGRGGGIASVGGNTIASLVLGFAVALGIGAIVVRSELLFNIVKYLGVAYVLYLGVQAIRHRKDRSHGETKMKQQSNVKIFMQGFIVGATNPKSIVFFIAVLPQFISIKEGNPITQMMVLAAIFTLIAFISDGAWVLLAAGARRWFASSPGRLDTLRGIGGFMMIGLAITLLFASRA